MRPCLTMVAAGNPLTINVFITVISFKVISKSTKHVPLTTLYTTVPALTQSVLMVAFPEYGLTIPFPIKLVLNTLRKMHKSEFWMNFYTDGRNTNLINPLLIKTFTYTQAITLAPNYGQEIRIPITVPDGYIFLCVTNVKSNGDIAYSYYTGSSSNVLTCFVGNDRNTQKIIPQGISADVLFMKKWW